MKKVLTLFLVLFGLIFRANCQVILSSQCISPLGGSSGGSFGQFDYTVGQISQETILFPNNIVSQGFQQPPFNLAGSFTSGVFCNGDSIHIPLNALGFRASENVFTAELSDAYGGWTAPLVLATDTGTTSTVLNARLPFNLTSGNNYRIRIRSSIPEFTSVISGSNQVDFCWIKLTVRALVEGLYQGDGKLTPLLYNLGLSGDSTACDSALVSLMYAAPPYDDIWNFNTILHTDGSLQCLLPSIIYGPGGFYIRIKTRNGIEVWSKTLVVPWSQELEFSFKD